MNTHLFCSVFVKYWPHRTGALFAALFLLLCLCFPNPSRSEPLPLMDNTAWHRLDVLSADLPFAWARRYLELRSIAEDADTYSRQLPSQLEGLRTVSMAAQKNVVTLFLDMIPAQSNVQETGYILGLLDNWRWRLEQQLRRTDAVAASVQQSLKLLEAIGQAVAELQATPEKRPIMEKASQDYYELYILVHERVQRLHEEMSSVRSVALGLYSQIKTTSAEAVSHLHERWIDYYTVPQVVSQSAFSRLGTSFITMCENLSYDESYPSSVPFALLFNLLVLFCLMLVNTVITRTANLPPQNQQQKTYAQSLCKELSALDFRYKLAFNLSMAVMMNSVVDRLPQFHESIPYLGVQHICMTAALALWARRFPDQPECVDLPKVWELTLPIAVGLILLHGDAGALLTLLGMGGSLLISLLSLLRRGLGQSTFRFVWLATLIAGLMLTVLGFGRLAIPILMLVLVVRAAAGMLRVVNSSPSLLPFTMTRTWFAPAFTLLMGLMSISYLIGCSGLSILRNYWYANAVPILGFQVTFGDAVLTVLLLLGGIFASNISRQLLEKLGRDSRIIDASAVPVLHVVINCILAIIFGSFIMSSLAIDVSSMAFIGGGVSIGVGLAAKTVISNFFCGLVLIFSKAVRSGDVVEVNGITGRVLNVNMRATLIETLNNSILLVPNEKMLNNNLVNWSLHNLHVLEPIEVKLASETDVNMAVSVMEAAAATVPGVMAYPPPKALFSGFGEKSLNFTLKAWVLDVRTRATTQSEIRKALLRALSEHNIVLDIFTPESLEVAMVAPETSTM